MHVFIHKVIKEIFNQIMFRPRFLVNYKISCKKNVMKKHVLKEKVQTTSDFTLSRYPVAATSTFNNRKV